MKKWSIIFAAIVFAVWLVVDTVREFFANDTLQYYSAQPSKLIYVAVIAVLGGLATLGYDKLSPLNRQRTRAYVLGIAAIAFTVFAGCMIYGIVTGFSLIIDHGSIMWIFAVSLIFCFIAGYLWFEFDRACNTQNRNILFAIYAGRIFTRLYSEIRSSIKLGSFNSKDWLRLFSSLLCMLVLMTSMMCMFRHVCIGGHLCEEHGPYGMAPYLNDLAWMILTVPAIILCWGSNLHGKVFLSVGLLFLSLTCMNFRYAIPYWPFFHDFGVMISIEMCIIVIVSSFFIKQGGDLIKDGKLAKAALSSVAAILLFLGIMGEANLVICIGVIFLFLSIAIKRFGHRASLTGGVLFVGLLAYQTIQYFGFLLSSLVFTIPMLILIVIAIYSTHKEQQQQPCKLKSQNENGEDV